MRNLLTSLKTKAGDALRAWQAAEPASRPHFTHATTRAEAASTIRQQLLAAGIQSAPLDARLLLKHATGLSDTEIIAYADRPLGRAAAPLSAAFARRLRAEPMAYITGSREFWGLEFALNPHTLIPRPDSETLIEATLATIPDRAAPLTIMDLGTGSGCLLLSLLYEYPNATGIGVDASHGAVTAARGNARRLGLRSRARILHADWRILNQHRPVDLLISNPPYIAESARPTLPPDVREHEPARALFAGEDGLEAYRSLFARAKLWLRPAALAVIEAGAGQGDAIAAIAAQHGFAFVASRNDLAGIPRAFIFQFNPSHEVTS